jgi:hypothetical protein
MEYNYVHLPKSALKHGVSDTVGPNILVYTGVRELGLTGH